MHSNPVFRILGLIAWVITALAAINVGLMSFGYDFFKLPFVQNNVAWLPTYSYYIIGVCGVISLLLFFMAVAAGGCMCGCDDHNKHHHRGHH